MYQDLGCLVVNYCRYFIRQAGIEILGMNSVCRHKQYVISNAARVVILGYYKNKSNELRAAHAEGVMRTLVILEKEGLVKAG